jgi:hypothetical protein
MKDLHVNITLRPACDGFISKLHNYINLFWFGVFLQKLVLGAEETIKEPEDVITALTNIRH